MNLQEIEAKALAELERTETVAEIEKLRVSVVGRSGELTKILRQLGTLPKEERPKMGQQVNEVRERLSAAMDEREARLAAQEREQQLEAERMDITLPGESMPSGTLHPLSIVLAEIQDIFIGMGFEVKEGPEIELDKYNFEMLNIPADHPSRDEQDSFFFGDGVVLRTQTSPVQVRTMLEQKPPIRMIAPGRVFRRDDVDATHSPMFHQIEGLVVDKGINFGHLKGVLDTFAKALYGQSTKTKFRPGFFPFTEPSAEVDATCSSCGGEGCRICKGTGWIEILGCGMVHPNVLRACGVDPEEYSGFAFGMGVDRIANIKYNITDIRLLFEGDVRFLEQFKGGNIG